MKHLFLPILTAASLLAASCTDYRSQIDQLQQEIDQISDNLELIESVTDNLGALRDVLDILEAGDFIISAAPAADGYDFEFKTNGKLNVGSRTAGVSVGFADGAYFWTLDGQPIKDASGARLPIAVSPIFHARESGIELSADGGKSWMAADGRANSVITSVQETATKISITFLGGTVVAFPKEEDLEIVLSGDGSTLASTGRLDVDYLVSGCTDGCTVVVGPAQGLLSEVHPETAVKGVISFVRYAITDEVADKVRIFVSDGKGKMVSTELEFASLATDESFPVLNPVWEAYSIDALGGVAEVEINTNLDYEIEVEEGATWLSHSGSKALRTDKIVFSATANDTGRMRSAAITISSGAYYKVAFIYQDVPPQMPGQNLSAGGTANCYIVPAAGDYYFDATVMGCGPGGIMPEGGFHTADARLNPAGVEIMMEFGDEPLIENLRLEDGKVHFHATGAKGNITVYVAAEDGSVIWSWHLWCTDMPEEISFSADGRNIFTFLDRNLGATGAAASDGEATYGLYYQWGRKDPFCVEDFAGMAANGPQSIEYSINRPFMAFRTGDSITPDWLGTYNDYLWGNPDYYRTHPMAEMVKTIYDPCPAGYMVPPAHVFAFLRDKSRITFVENGLNVRGELGQTGFFPYSGGVLGSVWDGWGGTSAEACLVLWNSSAARYYLRDNDGAAVARVAKNSGSAEFNKADLRARGIPVRCIKQQ